MFVTRTHKITRHYISFLVKDQGLTHKDIAHRAATTAPVMSAVLGGKARSHRCVQELAKTTGLTENQIEQGLYS